MLARMARRTTDAAGWVVEVVILRPGGAAPSFRYFNVAIADVTRAVQAARKLPDVVQANRVEAVRSLSADEITAIGLAAGEVRSA
jgi:hypothetical protein